MASKTLDPCFRRDDDSPEPTLCVAGGYKKARLAAGFLKALDDQRFALLKTTSRLRGDDDLLVSRAAMLAKPQRETRLLAGFLKALDPRLRGDDDPLAPTLRVGWRIVT